MKITFLGAAQNVTGSKHLVQTNGFNLLLDCGLYQGKRSESNEQNKNLPFDAKIINAVILSHAHLDHCGTLPILVKNGFTKKIYCTKATAEIARYILLDSADIQMHDAEYLNSHKQNNEPEIIPIYIKDDVEETIKHFEPIDYFRISNQWTQLTENLRFKFYDAGHILGSAVSLIEIKEAEEIKTLAFTGDLGRDSAPILMSPETIAENTDTLITECTYGDRLHQPVENATKDFADIISLAVKNKSKIIVPAFSLGRTQEIIYLLHKLFNENKIPTLPVYIDSPLAENITEVFKKYTEYFDQDFWKDFGNSNESPFVLKNITYIKTIQESKNLNTKEGPFMVISASGMAEGGRILHHLKNNIGDSNNVVLITGYQAENTLGRKLQEGISPIKIYGESYDVQAKIITLNEFSAHADRNGLLNYIENIKQLKRIFLVHTEVHPAESFKQTLQKSLPEISVEIPVRGQSVEL